MGSPRYWFRAKRYGWGWGLPLTWEGWVVLAVWFGILFTIMPLLELPKHFGLLALFVIGMVAALVAICFWKGEPPRWRSGQ